MIICNLLNIILDLPLMPQESLDSGGILIPRNLVVMPVVEVGLAAVLVIVPRNLVIMPVVEVGWFY
jgi:hypothetical protein